MRAIALVVTPALATVRIYPNWLERLLGEDDCVLELEWAPRYGNRPAYEDVWDWRTVATKRRLDELGVAAAGMIRRALDFRPCVELAEARVLTPENGQ